MPDELSNLAHVTNDFTAAWDERKRLFERLRDLRLNDDDRKAAIADYKKACKHFDELRAALLK
jgi:hypothetical protein